MSDLEQQQPSYMDSIFELCTSNGYEIKMVRFGDSQFVSFHTRGMTINGHLDKGHKLVFAEVPNGEMRIMLLDTNAVDNDGDDATILWFDVTQEQFGKMKSSPSIGGILSEHSLFR